MICVFINICRYFMIFSKVFDHARMMDPTRPLTFACNREYNVDLVVTTIPNYKQDSFSVSHVCALDKIC